MKKLTLTLTFYNPFRQPVMLAAFIATVVLVATNTLPDYTLLLVLAASVRLHRSKQA